MRIATLQIAPNLFAVVPDISCFICGLASYYLVPCYRGVASWVVDYLVRPSCALLIAVIVRVITDVDFKVLEEVIRVRVFRWVQRGSHIFNDHDGMLKEGAPQIEADRDYVTKKCCFSVVSSVTASVVSCIWRTLRDKSIPLMSASATTEVRY